MQTDEELFQQCRSRDARAWEALVRRYQHPMLALAYQFAGNQEEARDLAQEIFVRVYQNMGLYDHGRSFRTWLYSVARNLCIDNYRRRRRERGRADTPVDEFHNLPSSDPAPDAGVAHRERREVLMQALDALGEINREAIVMKDLQDMSLQEMSDLLGVPIGTVKSRISRARVELGKAVLRVRRGVALSEDLS